MAVDTIKYVRDPEVIDFYVKMLRLEGTDLPDDLVKFYYTIKRAWDRMGLSARPMSQETLLLIAFLSGVIPMEKIEEQEPVAEGDGRHRTKKG